VAQAAHYTVWCSVHCDWGLCVDWLWLVAYGCIKVSTTVEKADIETFVNTEGNVAQKTLQSTYRWCPLWVSVVPHTKKEL
jgi:hypothetical protein